MADDQLFHVAPHHVRQGDAAGGCSPPATDGAQRLGIARDAADHADFVWIRRQRSEDGPRSVQSEVCPCLLGLASSLPRLISPSYRHEPGGKIRVLPPQSPPGAAAFFPRRRRSSSPSPSPDPAFFLISGSRSRCFPSRSSRPPRGIPCSWS